MMNFLSLFFFQCSLLKTIYLWLPWIFVAAHRLSLVVASADYSLVVVRRLLIAVASLVVAHKTLGLSGFSSCSTWAQLPVACEIFPAQGLNPCSCIGGILSHWSTREVPLIFFLLEMTSGSKRKGISMWGLLMKEAKRYTQNTQSDTAGHMSLLKAVSSLCYLSPTF